MLGFGETFGRKTDLQRTSTTAWDIEVGKAPEAEEQDAAPSGICSEILRTGIWRLWLVLAVFYTCKLSVSEKLSLCLRGICA